MTFQFLKSEVRPSYAATETPSKDSESLYRVSSTATTLKGVERKGASHGTAAAVTQRDEHFRRRMKLHREAVFAYMATR